MTATKRLRDLIESDADAKALAAALAESPGEATPAAQLADRLMELGVAPRTARAEVKRLVLMATPILNWPKADLAKLLRGTTVEAIAAALFTANGNRRERTLTLADALSACWRARKNGFAWVGGGNVANAYKYPAQQTGFVVAVRSDGKLRFVAGVLSASKGASVTNQLVGITARGTRDDYRAWADAAE